MSKQTIFTTADVGCHADGTYGRDHRRNILGILVEQSAKGRNYWDHNSDKAVCVDLASVPSDDYSEEQDAMDILQSVTTDGLVWRMIDGDLMLTA